MRTAAKIGIGVVGVGIIAGSTFAMKPAPVSTTGHSFHTTNTQVVRIVYHDGMTAAQVDFKRADGSIVMQSIPMASWAAQPTFEATLDNYPTQ